MILVKTSNFLHCLFLLKIGPVKMFMDVLHRKEAFLENKNMNLISEISEIFHDFGQIFELFSLFVFIENRSRNDVWGCSG